MRSLPFCLHMMGFAMRRHRVSLMLGSFLIAATAFAHDGEIRPLARHQGGEVDVRSIDANQPGPPPTVGFNDCNDLNVNIFPGQTEIVGNSVDDDCDGLADEDANNSPSTDTSDVDGDGVTIASGDCNDHIAAVGPGMPEIAGNLIDDNCNGIADEDAFGNPSSDFFDHDSDGFVVANDHIFSWGFEGPTR